ncbi:hypothetical protein TIFTF001_038300 [Ficus carica]|uniref:Uncharacterized protein n=1 Tax=Ficus carica TaxID=3494 RepID=A0AA88E742_FICCA|nr:hypothetical protein TIFTF001_038300 [Ficus carica]
MHLSSPCLHHFPSKIFKRAMEKAFVEAEINGYHFHCQSSFPPTGLGVAARNLSLLKMISRLLDAKVLKMSSSST